MFLDTVYYAILYGTIYNAVCMIINFIITQLIKKKKIKSPMLKMGLSIINSLLNNKKKTKRSKKKKKSTRSNHIEKNNNINSINTSKLPANPTMNGLLDMVGNLIGGLNIRVPNTNDNNKVKEVNNMVNVVHEKIKEVSEKEVSEKEVSEKEVNKKEENEKEREVNEKELNEKEREEKKEEEIKNMISSLD